MRKSMIISAQAAVNMGMPVFRTYYKIIKRHLNQDAVTVRLKSRTPDFRTVK